MRASALALAALGLALMAVSPALERDGGAGSAASAQAEAFAQLPLVAQATIAETIGRSDHAYHARAAGTGFTAANSRHDLSVRFGTRGLEVRSGGERLTLGLRAWGYGQALRPVAAADPQARANRVSYRRGPLTEWYANGPLGLEQGFTLRAPPAARAAGELTLALSLGGTLAPTLDPAGRGLSFGSSSLRYRGLTAFDARGRALPARLELRDGTLLLRVEDQGARYPLTIDPFVQQAKLTASAGAGKQLGFSVAVSGDTVVAGAPQDAVGANVRQGSAYVFVKPAAGWASMSESAKLTASDGAAVDELGISVAVAGDTVVATSTSSNFFRGSAYVFVKPAAGWANMTESAKLTASDGTMFRGFGSSVAMAGDTVVAGAVSDDIGPNANQGSAYVFVKPATGWASMTESAKLTASDGAASDAFGISVAVSGDTVVAGTLSDVGADLLDHGSAYVFVKPAAGWASMSESAKLTASDRAASDFFGFSVAVSGDTVVAGASGDNVGANSDQGSAYVFVKPATGWASMTEGAKLTASDGAANDRLGFSVAVAGDTVVAGAIGYTVGANPLQGSAYVFVKPTSGWASMSESAKLTASDGAARDLFGISVAVSGDTVVAAAPREGFSQGSAYVFGSDRPVLFSSTRTGNGDIYSVDSGGGTPVQLTSGPAVDAEPEWSPSSAQVAFTSTRDGNVELYLMNADGSNVTRLTTNAAIDTSPAWSPDGSTIAFASNRGAGRNWDIYVMNANGSGVTRLTTNAAVDALPAWSPDGTKLAFSSGRTGNGDIYSMNADGSLQTRLTSGPTAAGVDTEPAWSGSTIAFSTNRHGASNFEIYTMTSTGASQTRLTVQPGHDVTPAWAGDGAKLVFASNRTPPAGGLNFDIFTMNANGSGQTALVTHPAVDAFPDW